MVSTGFAEAARDIKDNFEISLAVFMPNTPWNHGMVWYGMVWYGMVWYGMVWPLQIPYKPFVSFFCKFLSPLRIYSQGFEACIIQLQRQESVQFRWRLIADIERGVLLLHMPGISSYSEQFGEFFETRISSLETSPQNDGYLQLERGWRYHPESKRTPKSTCGPKENLGLKRSRTATSAGSANILI